MLETRRCPLDRGTRRGGGGGRGERLYNIESIESLESLENPERVGIERPTGKTTIERI